MLPVALSEAKEQFGRGPSVQFESPLWDKAITFVSFLFLTLFGIAVGEDIASGGGDVSCLIPNELTKGQTKFVNSFCSGEVTLLRALVLFFLGEFLFLSIPHLVWLRVAGPHLETFLRMTSKLTRLKSNRTKLYDLKSRSFVEHLISRYTKSTLLRKSSLIKHWVQLGFALAFFVATLVAYLPWVSDSHLHGSYFDCSLDREVYARSWFEQFELFCQDPKATASANSCQNETLISVPCVVSLSSLFLPLWIISLACLVIASVAAIVGILWLTRKSYPDVLGYKGKAEFSYCVSLDLALYKPCKKWKKSLIIENDFHFLLVLLSYLDRGLCDTVADIVTEIELREKFLKGDEQQKRKEETLAKLKKVPKKKQKWFPHILSNWVLEGRVLEGQEENRFNTGVAIYCGSKGLLHPVGLHFKKMLVAVDVKCQVSSFLNDVSSSGDEGCSSREYDFDAEGWRVEFSKPQPEENRVKEACYFTHEEQTDLEIKAIRIPSFLSNNKRTYVSTEIATSVIRLLKNDNKVDYIIVMLLDKKGSCPVEMIKQALNVLFSELKKKEKFSNSAHIEICSQSKETLKAITKEAMTWRSETAVSQETKEVDVKVMLQEDNEKVKVMLQEDNEKVVEEKEIDFHEVCSLTLFRASFAFPKIP